MMIRIVMKFLLFSLFIALISTIENQASENNFMNDVTETNPLSVEWIGNYGGFPPFDKVKIEYFKPALEAAMVENLAEIDKITNDAAAPTFENTIAAMERTGDTLNRVATIYYIWQSNMNNPEVAKLSREMNPKLAELGDKISQNEKLFKRIEAVYNTRNKAKLTSEQKRLVEDYYTNFVRGGAKLGAKEKARMAEINQRLAVLFNDFSQKLLNDESKYLVLTSEDDLKGLPQSLKDAAASQAIARKANGKWIVVNTRSSVDPFLTYSERRDLREKVWKMFINRGDNGDENDTNAIIPEILQLRVERAKLLGYPTHAHFRLAVAMAKTPENAMDLMLGVWKPAVARVKEEVADMQALADKEGAKITIEPWDYKFYMEKVRKAKYDLDQNEVKPYLQLDKLREGMFYVAGELFDFKFTPVSGVPTYHPDVKVWEVTNRKTGKHIGLWYFDPYAREGKRSGAWMNSYRNQDKLDGETPTIVSNNSNFVKGKEGEPVLISWDDASTLFHEFGHALHGLNSNVTYPSLSGTNVARDYVEFPSQLLEHWLSTPEVLNKFALHYQTGKPMPKEILDKIEKSSKFNQGFATVEFLASALVDMKLHLAGDKKIDADKFERETLAELGMPKEIVMRHRTPQFGHVFSSDGYSAGYYSYLWADVITADAYGAFTEAGGPYDKKVGQRLIKYIFSVGNTIDPAEGYKKFRGRDPKVEALMENRGFAAPKAEVKSKKAKGKK